VGGVDGVEICALVSFVLFPFNRYRVFCRDIRRDFDARRFFDRYELVGQ
jgi:hypothetical protein